MKGALLLFAAVQLGGAFGSASAELLERTPGSITIDLEVEVLVSVDAVVAHVSFDAEPELTLPLLDRGDGFFGLTTELAPRNYVVVFDAIGPRGEASDPVTLHQLGIDLVSGSAAADETTEAEGLTESTRRVGWLAVAFAAASLSALAVWVLGGGGEEDEDGARSADEE
ncbi:MAG: hypothetical protein KY394_00615 [Actinobacteria bacterium]|nr:hypothetical protein [Actinomycetota bacterium]